MRQVVLISGCSSGFGLLTAIAAAKKGHRVFATLRDTGRRAALDRAVLEAGVQLEVLPLDVTQAESIAACVAHIEREAGHVDALVNNAGYGMGGSVFDLSMDELRAQLETNFFGAVALTKAVLPGMVRRRQGRILQVSSVNSRHSVPGLGAYCASKRALDGLSESLRYELAPFGVHVTSVQPGTFRTEVFQKRHLARAFGDAASPYQHLSERGLALIDRLVEKNADDPEKVAKVLVRLLEHPAPPLRVLVGPDARLQTLVRALLPERMWEWLVRRSTGFDAAEPARF